MVQLHHIYCGLLLYLCAAVVAPLEVDRQDSLPVRVASTGGRTHSFLPLISLRLDKWGNDALHGRTETHGNASEATRNNHTATSASLSKSRNTSGSDVLIGTLVFWIFIALCLLGGAPSTNTPRQTESPGSQQSAKYAKSSDSRKTSDLPPLYLIPTSQPLPQTVPPPVHPLGTANSLDPQFAGNRALATWPGSEEITPTFVFSVDQSASDHMLYRPSERDVTDEEATALLVRCNVISKQELESGCVSSEHLKECRLVAKHMLHLKPMQEWEASAQYGRQALQDDVAAAFEAEARQHAHAAGVAAAIPGSQPGSNVLTTAPPTVQSPPSVEWLPPGPDYTKADRDRHVSLGSDLSFGEQGSRTDTNNPYTSMPGSVRSNALNSARSYKSPVPILNCYDQPPEALPSSGSDIVTLGDGSYANAPGVSVADQPDDNDLPSLLPINFDQAALLQSQSMQSQTNEPDYVYVDHMSVSAEDEDTGAFPSVFSSSSQTYSLDRDRSYQRSTPPESLKPSPAMPEKAPNSPPRIDYFNTQSQEESKASASPSNKQFKLKAQETMMPPPLGWHSTPVPRSSPSQSFRLTAHDVMAPPPESLSPPRSSQMVASMNASELASLARA